MSARQNLSKHRVECPDDVAENLRSACMGGTGVLKELSCMMCTQRCAFGGDSSALRLTSYRLKHWQGFLANQAVHALGQMVIDAHASEAITLEHVREDFL